jgi:parvulin-like peptidyl-prolyl isomerase
MSTPAILKLALACSIACLLGQCRKPETPAATGEKPLAVVAGKPVTADALRAEAEWRRANKQPVPAVDALLKEMVDRMALVERARQAGLADEDATRRRIESLLIARLRELQLEPAIGKVAVSDEELKSAYQERSSGMARPGTDRFSILFQAADAKNSETRRAEARARLEAGLARADATPAPGGRGPAASGFGAVAIDCSDDQVSRYRGGDIGWIAADVAQTRFPDTVIKAGRALDTGKRSGIIEADDGFYAIMKTDSRPEGLPRFEDVAETLRQELLREKRRTVEERFIAESLDLAKARVNPDAARGIELPVSPVSPRQPGHPPLFPDEPQAASAAK